MIINSLRSLRTILCDLCVNQKYFLDSPFLQKIILPSVTFLWNVLIILWKSIIIKKTLNAQQVTITLFRYKILYISRDVINNVSTIIACFTFHHLPCGACCTTQHLYVIAGLTRNRCKKHYWLSIDCGSSPQWQVIFFVVQRALVSNFLCLKKFNSPKYSVLILHARKWNNSY